MAITITSLGAAPVLDPAVLVAGGTLAANTTYYVVVVAKNTIGTYDIDHTSLYTSPSNQISFTTDTINKSVNLTWSAVVGAIRYEVFITTVSGDYKTNSNVCNSSSVATTSYLINGIINTIYHASLISAPYSGMQSLPLGLNKNSPLIRINISGNETLQSIYNALVAAGYAGNVYYDGLNFALHGNIVIDAGVVGSLTIINTTMWFAHCFFRNLSTSFNLTIGSYNAVTKTSSNGCVISAEFYNLYFTNINIYLTKFGFFRWTGVNSNIGSQINAMHSGIIDCTFDGVRNTNTNWSNNKVTNPIILRGWSGGNQINAYFDVNGPPTFNAANSEPDDYTDCIIKINYAGYAFTMTLSAVSGRIANFYDCTFIGAYFNSINDLIFNFASFAGLNEEQFRFYYSVQGGIIDTDKNLLSDANVKCYDKDSNLIFNTNTVAGLIPKNYVKVLGIVPTGNGTGPSYYNKIIPNPFTLVISKAGYETYTTKFDLLKKFDEIITLKPVTRTRYTIEGKPLRALTPESGSSSKLLEL